MKTRELDKLKKKLPRGYRIKLWKKINSVSLSAIDAVLRGDYFNKTIIDAAIELAEEHQAELNSAAEKIKSL